MRKATLKAAFGRKLSALNPPSRSLGRGQTHEREEPGGRPNARRSGSAAAPPRGRSAPYRADGAPPARLPPHNVRAPPWKAAGHTAALKGPSAAEIFTRLFRQY